MSPKVEMLEMAFENEGKLHTNFLRSLVIKYHTVGSYSDVSAYRNGVYSVVTKPLKLGTNQKFLYFYAHYSEDSFVGARAVENRQERAWRSLVNRDFP